MSSDSTRESVIPEERHIRRLMRTANLMGKIKQSLPTDGNWKRDADSIRSRELGNARFRAGEMREALRCYGDAVLTAGTDRVQVLALANRSAALLYLKQYRDCLQDIVAALDLGYDAPHKLYLRRAKCHQALSAGLEALTALTEYRRQLLAMQLPAGTREKLLLLGDAVEQRIAQLPEADSVDDVSPVPAVSYGTHKQLVGASSALQLRQDDDQGRHVVAARDLLAGDTLYVEQPYFCLLLPERRLDHCHHCIRHTHALIPCERCCDVGYCSAICRRDAAATYHGSECGFAGFLDGFGIGRAALRVLTTAGWERVLALRGRLQEGRACPTCSVQHCRCYTDAEDRYLSVFHLVTHLDKCAAEDLYHYSRAALTFAVFLRERTQFFSSSSAEDRQLQLVWTAALLLRHVLQLVCNAHAQTQLMARPDCDVTQLREERVATAVYPSASYMNHSCDPSIINSYYGRCLVVRAIKPVSTGQQVYHCYGAHYARMSTVQRGSALLHQYYFTCRCPYCTESSLTTFLERLDSFRCVSCGDVTLPADDIAFRYRCLSCRVIADYTEQRHLVDQISANLEADEGLSVGELLEMKTRTLRVVSASHRMLAAIEDALSRRYTQQGMLEEAVRCLESTLNSVAVRYGSASVELGHTLLTYTDVLQLLVARHPADGDIRSAQLKTRLTQAKQIFSVNYGEWSEIYRELQCKLRDISAVDS